MLKWQREKENEGLIVSPSWASRPSLYSFIPLPSKRGNHDSPWLQCSSLTPEFPKSPFPLSVSLLMLMDCFCSVAAQPLSLRLRARRSSSSFLSPRHAHRHRLHSLSPLLLRCSLPTQPQRQDLQMPFVAHYLISSFGFSADWALKHSSFKNLIRIKTPEQPDSVVRFLKEIGLSDPQIRSLILFDPNLLSSSVEKILRPRGQVLMDAGFTGEILSQSIQSNP